MGEKSLAAFLGDAHPTRNCQGNSWFLTWRIVMRFTVFLILVILLAATVQVVYADGEAPTEDEQVVVVVPPEEDPETETDGAEPALPAPEAPEEITAAEQPEVDTASQPAAEAESLDGFAPLTGEELLDCGAEADPSMRPLVVQMFQGEGNLTTTALRIFGKSVLAGIRT